MGVVSGALPQVANEYALSEKQQEWVVGILYLGGGLGAAVGGALCDSLGRKACIIVTDGIFIFGALLLYFAPNIEQILIGRVAVGFGISVSGIADVAYLNEIAPLQWRGSIVSVNEACISLGFLLAFICAVVFENVNDGWRHMFGISGWVALLQLIGMLRMPESPVWLFEKGRSQDREVAMQKIYGSDLVVVDTSQSETIQEAPVQHPDSRHIDVTDTSATLVKSESRQRLALSPDVYDSLPSDPSQELDTEQQQNRTTFKAQILYLASILQRWRRQAWIALFLSVFQQLSGQAAVLNYAPRIFSSLNHDDLSATLYIGGVKFAVTVLVIWRIEYTGRRCLLLSGMSMIVAGQLLVAFAFLSQNQTGATDDDMVPLSAMFFALPGILMVVLGYSASFGPLTWLLTSELFPTDIRGRALGASTIVTYLCASLVTSTFLSLQSAVGASIVFLAYGLATAAGMVFVSLAIAETGNKSVKEIDESLQRMLWWRWPTRDEGMLDTIAGESPRLGMELT
jgi:MFS family permease